MKEVGGIFWCAAAFFFWKRGLFSGVRGEQTGVFLCG
jgi:hypothetical protein